MRANGGLVADLTVTFRAGNEVHFTFLLSIFCGIFDVRCSHKKGKRAHVRQVVLFVERGRGVRVSMGRAVQVEAASTSFAVVSSRAPASACSQMSTL